MKKILLSVFLLLSITIHAQIIQTPSQSDYCTNQTINFTYTASPPAGSHYEWMYEDYSAGWSISGPVNVLYLGSQPSIQVYTSSISSVCMVRLLTIDDLTGQIINSDGRSIASSQPSANIPYRFHTDFSTCGALEVPPPLDPLGGSPQRWAMWYKNGQATGISSYYYSDPSDSAWYEYKVKLNCGDTLTTGLFYLPRPSAPSITAQGSTTFCTGDSVVLTASSSATIDNWYLNGVAIAGSTGKSSLTVGTSGQYTMRSKASNGNGTYCYRYSNAITVTQNPGAYISGLSQACYGDSIQLSCTTANTYQWKRNGVNIAGGNTQNIWVKQSGNYTVNTTGISCNSSPTKTVTIYLNPSNLSITPGAAQTLCSGSTITLTVTGSNISTYQWLKNGIAMPGATTATSTFTSTGNYKCVVTNAIGCSKTSPTVQVSAAPVAALPQKTLVLQPGTEGMDSYITSNFGNYTTNFGTAATIEISNWYKYFRNAERGYLQFDLSQIPDFSAVTSATLKLFVDSIAQKNVNAGLPNSLFIKRNTQAWNESTISWSNSPDSTEFQSVAIPCSTITSSSFLSANIVHLVRHWINSPAERFGMLLQLNDYSQVSWLKIASSDTSAPTYRPKLTITYSAADINASGPLNLCTGGSVQFTTNAGAYTYQWYKNGNPIAGATSSTYTATSAGDYHVVLTASSGCSARSLIKTVTLNAPPQINLTPSADSISYCFGSPITLTVDSLAGYTFQWRRNNANITGAIYKTFTPTITAWYSIKSTNACGVIGKDSIYVTRINNAAPVITAGGPTSFCAGQSVVLTSTTFAGATTKWYQGTSLVATATTYTATTAGAYSVTQTASGCSKSSNTINVVVNCREGEFTAEGFIADIYPNPAETEFQISTPEGIYNVVITDLSGKQLKEMSINGTTHSISTDGISDGVYLVSILQEGKVAAVKKLAIHH